MTGYSEGSLLLLPPSPVTFNQTNPMTDCRSDGSGYIKVRSNKATSRNPSKYIEVYVLATVNTQHEEIMPVGSKGVKNEILSNVTDLNNGQATSIKLIHNMAWRSNFSKKKGYFIPRKAKCRAS